jgi:hypothetical protein
MAVAGWRHAPLNASLYTHDAVAARSTISERVAWVKARAEIRSGAATVRRWLPDYRKR